jgi:hypothetical protein
MVVDEVFYSGYLVLCQVSKFYTTAPHRNRDKWDIVTTKIPDGLKGHGLQAEVVFTKEQVQPA